MFIIHTCNLANGSWIKVHENSFRRIIVEVKNACIEATQALISKLQKLFLDYKIMMMALGLVLP
jgi:hypothetical protein